MLESRSLNIFEQYFKCLKNKQPFTDIFTAFLCRST